MYLIRKDIQAALERDPAARSKAEVILCYPGFHAIVMHRLAHFIWQRGFCLLARWLSHISRFLTGIEIHPGARIAEGFFIDHGMGVVIGETSIIGRNCTIYHGVTLGGVSLQKGKRHPTLEEGVVVGVGARILGPHAIGAGSRVGAGSVVISNVPPGCTVVGVPARIVFRDGEGKLDQPVPLAFNHHLLPDPVEGAIQALNLRIAHLERELDQLHESAGRERRKLE
ncbi:MAG: serine O-acetyltransferase [Candidatus Tectomicrobia bacterium]|uniref:Serine acetyltransferase n=1 Tax=Tectimicrobiota bacterium TaxID=2528274 RepID=A0A932I3V1_UNCTE|nr:serine O-acetyltransferase [Candidatus Tectomicrobia bacterium]